MGRPQHGALGEPAVELGAYERLDVDAVEDQAIDVSGDVGPYQEGVGDLCAFQVEAVDADPRQVDVLHPFRRFQRASPDRSSRRPMVEAAGKRGLTFTPCQALQRLLPC
jgi:hypothetical protein